MAFIMLPLSSCIDDEPKNTDDKSENWMPDFNVHTYEVNYESRNYFYNNGSNYTTIYFDYSRTDFYLNWATIKALGTVISANSESINMDIYGTTSFPHYLAYKENKGYLIEAEIWKRDYSKHSDVWYYFYFFKQNGKLYYSYQRIQ